MFNLVIPRNEESSFVSEILEIFIHFKNILVIPRDEEYSFVAKIVEIPSPWE